MPSLISQLTEADFKEDETGMNELHTNIGYNILLSSNQVKDYFVFKHFDIALLTYRAHPQLVPTLKCNAVHLKIFYIIKLYFKSTLVFHNNAT